MVAVLDAEGLTPSEKIVAISYADHAHHDGTEARAGLDRIARKSALSRRTVNTVVKSLLSKKVLVVQRPATNKLPVCYRFLLAEDGKSLLHFRPAESASQEVGGDAVTDDGDATDDVLGCDSCTQTVNEPSEEPSSSPEGEQYSERFENLWAKYPRKEGKKAAYRKTKTLIRKGVRYEDLITATENYAFTVVGRDPDKIKLGSTFFGPDDHWREFCEAPAVKPNAAVESKEWEEEIERRHEEGTTPHSDFFEGIRKQMTGG